jgi:muramidase (phage lysozyme)
VLIDHLNDCCKAAMEMIDTGIGGVLQALNKAIEKLKTIWGSLPASRDVSTFLISLLKDSQIFRVTTPCSSFLFSFS